MKVWLIAALWLASSMVHAQDVAACNPELEDCGCQENWGCWELLYTTKGTILGVKGTASYVSANTSEFESGFVTVYATEHFGTRDNLSVHFAFAGSIGGGTAGNEGSLFGAFDFGYRGRLTDTSGLFLRAGLSGMLAGHGAFFVSLFEPFQGRLGYQWLAGDTLVEVGMTHGFVPVARFNPGDHAARSLSRARELGGYAAVHFAKYRVDASFLHVFDRDGRSFDDDVQLGRAQLCDYHFGLTVCLDGLFARGRATSLGRERMTRSLYMGLTLGFSP